MSKDEKTLYDLKATLKFLKQTKNGEYAEIEQSSFEFIGAKVEAKYIPVDETEYYFGFDTGR